MTHNLRLVKGGIQPPADAMAVESCHPDRMLLALIDEARALETRDRLFNARVEMTIEQSDAWRNGDRRAALNAVEVSRMREEHQPVVDRLMHLPDLIADTPAYTREGVAAKLRYLATLLDGVEGDILDSVIEDVEHLR